jgi:hypothetical protein
VVLFVSLVACTLASSSSIVSLRAREVELRRNTPGGFLITALLALLVLLGVGTAVRAGTTGGIEGKVTDENGNGVTGVTVTASSPAQILSVTTTMRGFYSILDLSPDTYAVTSSKDGYDSATINGVTVTADQTTSANIKLVQMVKVIGRIETTATASLISKTVTGDLYAVNAQAIKQYNGGVGGAETLYSQNSVVGSLPGVVRFIGSGGGYYGQGTLSLRGGSFSEIGYELDGVPMNRGFDFYNGTGFVTNGLAGLQVYTGGAPPDEGRALSGYINQVIARGKYPGGADFTTVVGTPLYNHSIQADIYGATPDDRFTYYVSTLATNAYFNFGDRSNLANTSFRLPAGDPGCGAFNIITNVDFGLPALNCNQSYVLNEPMSQGALFSNPFNAGRDTVTNLHWSFVHNRLKDDLQAEYLVGTTFAAPFGMYGTTGADPAIATQFSGFFGGAGLNANGQLTWPTGSFYQGRVGQPYNPAQLITLTWPSSGGSANGVIPSTFQDSQSTEYNVEKLGYARAMAQSSFLRLYGYQMYSAWNLNQFEQPFAGNSFYQLHDNATGVTVEYQNQVNQQDLVRLIGDWSRDVTLRYDYQNFRSIGGIVGCAVGGAPIICAPGTPVARIGAPSNRWNSVTPLDWDAALADRWKPSDKLLFDFGLRWDEFAYQLMPMKITGPDGLAYLAEEQNGMCLYGYSYSASDPKILGANGDQNCYELLLAGSTAEGGSGPFQARDLPGAAAWQDVLGSLTFTDLSPRFGATDEIDPRDVIRASVGRYVQPPNSAWQQYRANPLWGPGVTVRQLNGFYNGLGYLAVHDILPEDSTNYDLSLEHEFPGTLSVKLTPYYKNTRNQLLFIPIDPHLPGFASGNNLGAVRTHGLEFLAQKPVAGAGGIGGTLAVTDTSSKIRFTSINGKSYINLLNGTDAAGRCTGSGICGYNRYYGTNYRLLDPSGYYAPSFFLGPTATSQSYSVQWVINLTLVVRTHGFDIVPAFNYQSGNPYGDPLNFPDAHCPTAGSPPVGSGCIPLPAGKTTAFGANGPDPYTGQFDSLGSMSGPSWWTLNVAVSHSIGRNLEASILGTNLIAGIHNHGYPWEHPASQQNISYADNGFYYNVPLGAGGLTAPSPPTAYYGNNYYPYASNAILPYRDWVFSVSSKI